MLFPPEATLTGTVSAMSILHGGLAVLAAQALSNLFGARRRIVTRRRKAIPFRQSWKTMWLADIQPLERRYST